MAQKNRTPAVAYLRTSSAAKVVDDTPTMNFVRQVLGAVAQLDNAMTVAKLRDARDRKPRQEGWCEGGAPSHERYPEAARMAKRLYRTNPVTDKHRSLRKIAAELAASSHFTEAKYRGSKVARLYNPGTIKAMIEAPAPKSPTGGNTGSHRQEP